MLAELGSVAGTVTRTNESINHSVHYNSETKENILAFHADVSKKTITTIRVTNYVYGTTNNR
jgi:hypothetical protein